MSHLTLPKGGKLGVVSLNRENGFLDLYSASALGGIEKYVENLGFGNVQMLAHPVAVHVQPHLLAVNVDEAAVYCFAFYFGGHSLQG
ncbi:hypothetical protein EI546_06425 [Aequorivita sp. H23M31]|uniref:Uncharacterized protein n=1 Tax=Aequorivita ciconiae TaxID=2494375 RepID=A0A410G2D2_9FLAO|nr:hypothetical protein [Aequorivita sp. H23M31]QAA81385.1 hypothetical protein EI546_06425 [Aequorivita sp. H23M31]